MIRPPCPASPRASGSRSCSGSGTSSTPSSPAPCAPSTPARGPPPPAPSAPPPGCAPPAAWGPAPPPSSSASAASSPGCPASSGPWPQAKSAWPTPPWPRAASRRSAWRAPGRARPAPGRELHPPHLRRVTPHLRHCLDPDGALAEAVRQEQDRYLHLSPGLDGVWYIDGRLGPEGGARLAAALTAIAGPPGREDKRSAAQRRADALVDLVSEGLDSGSLPRTGGQRPHLMLIADLVTLQRQPGSRAAELDWGQTICGESARRLACDAALTAILVDEQGEPLSVGRTTRVVPAGMRRALVLRDRSCRWPGCGRPATWCDAHHLE